MVPSIFFKDIICPNSLLYAWPIDDSTITLQFPVSFHEHSSRIYGKYDEFSTFMLFRSCLEENGNTICKGDKGFNVYENVW